MTKARAFLRATAASTTVEYAIIGAFVSIAFVVGASSLGTNLNARFTTIANMFS